MADLPEHAAHARYRAEQTAPAVKVKPLVWQRAPEGFPYDWQAWCDLMGGYYLATSEGAKREHEAVRAARILATIEAVPVAEVWRRAIEAAAQAADDMRASLWADTPSKCLTDIGALHEVAAAIRALPLPDDLR